MKFFIPTIALFSFLAISLPTTAQMQTFTKFSKQDLRDDYSFIFDLLRKQHPNPYKFEDSLSVSQQFDSLAAIMDRSDNVTRVIRLSPLQLFHDVHTKMEFDEETINQLYKEIKHCPLALSSFRGRMFNNTAGGPIAFGAEILSINTMPVNAIWKELNYALYSDGYIETGTDRAGMNLNFMVSLIFPTADSYQIEYRISPSAKPKTISLASVDAQAAFHIRNHGQLPFNTFLTRSNITEDYNDQRSTAILTVLTFMIDETSFYKALKSFFTEVDKRKIQNVILDIRNNGGGDPNMSALMYSFIALKPFDNVFNYRTRNTSLYQTAYLLNSSGLKVSEEDISTTRNFFHQRFDYDSSTGYYYGNKRLTEGSIRNYPPDKNNFRGNVYVLTSGATVSAATYFAALVKNNHRGLIIGSETGSGETSTTAAWFNTYQLPRTNVKVMIPMSEMYFMDSHEDNGRGCLPDRQLTFDEFQHYIQLRKDPELSFTFDIIGKRTK